MKSQILHLVSATEQAIARPDFRSHELNVRLVTNEVSQIIGNLAEFYRANRERNPDKAEDAWTELGIHLRAAERLRQEVEAALEARRDGAS